MGNNVAIGGCEWPMNWEMLYDKIIANEMVELEYVVGLVKTISDHYPFVKDYDIAHEVGFFRHWLTRISIVFLFVS